MNQKAMYHLTYGLFVLTAALDGKDNGCIINTAGQVTSSPNRISIAVNKANLTHDMILQSGKFNLSILSEQANFELFKHFGFQSGKTADKFAGYTACRRSENGLCYITEGTNAYISAAVEQTIDLGSHTMFVAEVVGVVVEDAYMDESGRFGINETGLVVYSHGEYFAMGEKLGKFGYSVQKKK